MFETLTSSIYFGATLTLAAYCIAVWFNKKLPNPLTTPLLIGTALVLDVLLLLDIPYEHYNAGAKYLNYFLIPVTVCFAVPTYRQIHLLKKYFWPIVTSVVLGCAASVLSVIVLCLAFGLGDIAARSLAAISVSTAIAIGITEQLGGIVSLTVFAVILTGILGASVGDTVCRLFRIRHPVARGVAIGNSSHAAGTIKALEMGPVEGAMSSLSIVLSGIATAILAPLFIGIFFFL
jgi:predicted murein hydrolase (TIGR00659 family)